jgi:hypothetical protein
MESKVVVRPLVAGVGVVVCTVAMAATVVGHPVPTGFAAGTGIAYTSGAMDVSTIVFDRCGAASLTVDYYEILDPVAGDEIVLPAGDVCGVKINLADRLEVYGTGPSNSSFALSLGVPSVDIVVDPAITVAQDGSSGGTGIRLADPNWITATLLDLDPDEHVSVGAGHALHSQLSDAVRYDSLAW